MALVLLVRKAPVAVQGGLPRSERGAGPLPHGRVRLSSLLRLVDRSAPRRGDVPPGRAYSTRRTLGPSRGTRTLGTGRLRVPPPVTSEPTMKAEPGTTLLPPTALTGALAA